MKGTRVAIRVVQLVEDSGVARTVRELLDDARSSQGSDIAAARSMAQQARVLARTLD
ncbi:MAG: hypothetical protein F2534_10230, partial [Actinobacteria bacterium]|nr:hypothetical protein [Actinomycetota bacterium]